MHVYLFAQPERPNVVGKAQKDVLSVVAAVFIDLLFSDDEPGVVWDMQEEV